MKLSEAEELVMSVLWDSKKPMNLFEVDKVIQERYKKIWQIQTIVTFITRLKNKGYIKTNKVGRHTYYEPIIKKTDYTKMELEDMAMVLFEDDMQSLVLFAIKLLEQ